MKLEHESVENLRRDIARIVGKHLDTDKYRVFFFGSRVKGDSMPRSDIDIGIEGPEEIPRRVKAEIEEELEELPILYEMDVVDFTAASEKFRHFARRWTEPII
ncbi:hypothetical protein A3J43_01640 [Candidatus Uhrbacteria bacterium RIFCSPHIGHO2_12_FULL_54_23]|uniref:Polymerase beta nucleotidyltransferase domain-containing protein n=1 Tax=Candidatus Uhrbacteria bacterium RIFCSPHIGHO2_12_FULL_54_23 TaxID=1802397 RepID=A0A1F7ULY1_9BACT|nr:MAG: hypothetical protein A3J43_01640 [Candidatus Uhrbacteria bacterium RIFCSPHIGHO2_12_FULL_54_23]